MKSRIIILFIACTVIYSWNNQSYSLTVDTHKAINEHIAQFAVNGFNFNDYLSSSLGFNGGSAEELSGDADGQVVSEKIFWWLGYGGVMEDRPGSFWDYVFGKPTRNVNHFHNPLGESGLDDILSGRSDHGCKSVTGANVTHRYLQ